MIWKLDKSVECLIAARADIVAGIDSLRAAVHSLRGLGEVLSVSAVYCKRGRDLSEPSLQLLTVIKLSSHLEPQSIVLQLSDLVSNQQLGPKGSFTLLSYAEEVQLDPDNPLPHPMLASDPTVLSCATESWGAYRHPILLKTLNELAGLLHNNDPVEFYAQGKVLL